MLWHWGCPAAGWPVGADSRSTLELCNGLVLCCPTFVYVWCKIKACRNIATGRNKGLMQLWLFWTREGQTANQCREVLREEWDTEGNRIGLCLCCWLMLAGQAKVKILSTQIRKKSIIKKTPHIHIKMLSKMHLKIYTIFLKDKVCLEVACLFFCSQHPCVLSPSWPKWLVEWGKRGEERDQLCLKATAELDLVLLNSQEVLATALLLHLSAQTDRSKCHH